MDSETRVLEYRSKTAREPYQHSLPVALLLCAPGGVAYLILFVASIAPRFAAGLIGDFIEDIFYPLLFLAITTAIVSIVFYATRRVRPMPWYVVFNLSINVSGLLFAAICILLALVR